MSHTIKVDVSRKSAYPVHIGMDLWSEFQSFCQYRYSSRKLFVIIDEKVDGLHGSEIRKQCKKSFDECLFITVAEGESSKSADQWNKIADWLLNNGIERTTPILSVGGGVTGDLAGFVAATVLRGVPLIHMPTTLLAMVDSSIGGKTGINHSSGKNRIGSFYQPDAVFSSLNFLETLAGEEWINGLAEVIKYAAIRDAGMFNKIQPLAGDGFSPSEKWAELIMACVQIKADIVQKDAFESGVRAVLNFGHTFGHALEKAAGYGAVAHGHAVFVGMLAAVYASAEKGAPINNARLEPFIPLYKRLPSLPSQDVGALIDLMGSDKKVKDETIRLVLLNDWGNPYIYSCTDRQLLESAWEHALKQIT